VYIYSLLVLSRLVFDLRGVGDGVGHEGALLAQISVHGSVAHKSSVCFLGDYDAV
jgi:hypothetical protein